MKKCCDGIKNGPSMASSPQMDVRADLVRRVIEFLGAASSISELLHHRELNYFIGMALIEAQQANMQLLKCRAATKTID